MSYPLHTACISPLQKCLHVREIYLFFHAASRCICEFQEDQQSTKKMIVGNYSTLPWKLFSVESININHNKVYLIVYQKWLQPNDEHINGKAVSTINFSSQNIMRMWKRWEKSWNYKITSHCKCCHLIHVCLLICPAVHI